MEIKDFVEETSKLEKYFGKELDKFQREIWYSELKNIKVERYRKIIREIFKKNKFMPKLADILEIQTSLPYTEIKKEYEQVECELCESKGFIIFKKRVDEHIYNYFARCICANGNKYNLSKIYIPTIRELGLENALKAKIEEKKKNASSVHSFAEVKELCQKTFKE